MALGLSDHLWTWEEFLRLPIRHQPEIRQVPIVNRQT
jgi:hypothetical protein